MNAHATEGKMIIRGQRIIACLLVCAGFTLLLLDVSLRTYLWTQNKRFRLFTFNSFIATQYQGLRPLVDHAVHRDGRRMKVLLLGPSTFHPHYGSVEDRLNSKLEAHGIQADLFNLSNSALTTRDGLFQYMGLNKSTFDAVVLYHGINEVRANNCPPDVFNADYTHYGWYEELNIAYRHRISLRYTVIPYCMDALYHRLRQRLRPQHYIPEKRLRSDWLHYGSDIKTAPAFRNNMNAILEEARCRGDTPILMTFAWYVPSNYTIEAFRQHALDYGNHWYSVEVWGERSNVVAGIKAHNEVVRQLAQEHPEARFIDVERLIPKTGLYFNDICHLTDNGCDLIAEALCTELAHLAPARSVPTPVKSATLGEKRHWLFVLYHKLSNMSQHVGFSGCPHFFDPD